MTCESRLVPALRIAFYKWNYFSCFSQFTCCHEGIFRECVFKYKANYYRMITLLKYTLPHGTNLTIILIGDISVLFLAAIVASLLREARSKIVSTRIYTMQTLCS